MSRTIEMLRCIPDLAALAYVSRATPHRTEGGRRSARTGSPIPAEVACLDMLRPDEHGLLAVLSAAVRVVVEEMRASDVYEPTPNAEPTWASECGYLIAQSAWWQADDFAGGWVAKSTSKVHRALSLWVGQPPPPRLICPRCRGRITEDRASDHPDAAGVLACGDCGHVWHAKDVAHEAVMGTPMSLTDIAPMVGVTDRTLRRWAEAGILVAVSEHEPSPRLPALYLPGDVKRLAEVVKTG